MMLHIQKWKSFHSSEVFKLLSILIYLITQELKILQAYRPPPLCHTPKDKCSCDIHVVIMNLKTYAYDYQEVKLQDKLRAHFCQMYIQLPEFLRVEASTAGSIFGLNPLEYMGDYPDYGMKRSLYDMRDRRRYYSQKRFKRQINLGVPTNDVFEDALAQVRPHTYHQYVIYGSTVRFQCSGGMDDEMDGSRITKMTWSHLNGEPITSPQVSIDAHSGTLTIPTVQLSDVDIYNCTEHLQTEEGGHISRVYAHQLSVISEPIFWLQMFVEYETKYCNHEEVKLIREKLGPWIELYACAQCEVHNDTVGCSSSNPDVPSTYKIHLVVSAIGLEIQLQKSIAERFYACQISCLEIMQEKILEYVRDNMMKMFRLPIEVRGNGDNKLVHNAVENSFEIELLMGCLAGFFLQYKLCFPCSPGSYSSYGTTECYPCPMGHYQPQPAASSCIPCGHGLDTFDIGSVSYSECHQKIFADTAKTAQEMYQSMNNPANTGAIIGGVIGGLVVLIIIVLIIICACCPESKVGQCLRKCFCCCCRGSTTSVSYEVVPTEDTEEAQINDSKGRGGNAGQRRHSNTSPGHARHSKDNEIERPSSRSKRVKQLVRHPNQNQDGPSRFRRPPTPPPMPPVGYPRR